MAENYQHWSLYNYATNDPISIIDPDGRSTESMRTRYVDPNGNTILNTNDGRDDVFMVPWNKIKDFKNNIFWTNKAGDSGTDAIGWNSYWRGEFNQVISESQLHTAGNNTLRTESAKAAQVKAILTGNKSDFRDFVGKLWLDRWGDPVFVANNIVAGLNGFVNLPFAPSNTIRVGRWMSVSELKAMQETGRMMEGAGGQTFAATSGPESFGSQAAKGSVYVEFDVSKNSLLQGGRPDWVKGVGPGANASMRLSIGKQGGEMLPQVSNIKVIKTK